MTAAGEHASSAEETGSTPRRVLVLDDDGAVARGMGRILRVAGYEVTLAHHGETAIAHLIATPFDVILSDIMMPGMSGTEFLRAVRAHDFDVPVILMTGNPTVETAAEAVALGATQYLTKPITPDELLASVERACKLHRLARLKRDALAFLGASAGEASDRAGLQGSLDRCLGSMWMAFQPIVEMSTTSVLGYEALMRSTEVSMPHPGAVLAAAERLDRVSHVGRRVRELTAAAFSAAPPGSLLFINLHARDLLDEDLYAAGRPLTTMANRVVLEITERASVEDVPDVVERVKRLRALGFQIAIDDLGAGYAGLSSIVALEPDFVKLDMSLVRNVHQSNIQRNVVGSLARLCKDLGMRVVAEGIETPEERDALRALGCDLLQGYFFAKPGRPFPELVGRFS
jgi:EAL domain-containing protein (putative c-di-GMP-specific phosphodiesterase class I)/CheY-like chemotaxis protein